MKRKTGNQKKTHLQAIDSFTTFFVTSKEQMDVLLRSPAIRINGIMWDIPIFQIQKYQREEKYGYLKYTLTQAKNQDPNQTKTTP